MPHEYNWKCSSCEYEAQFGASPDLGLSMLEGLSGFTITISCDTCKKVMGFTVPPPHGAKRFFYYLVLLMLVLLLCSMLYLGFALWESVRKLFMWRQHGDLFLWLGGITGVLFATGAWLLGNNLASRFLLTRNLVLRCIRSQTHYSEVHPCHIWKGECPRCGAAMKRGRHAMSIWFG